MARLKAGDVAGSVAIVTGGSRGLGLAIARAAQLGARGAGVLPGLTARLLRLMAMRLPDADGDSGELIPGRKLRQALPAGLFDWLTALGRKAVRRLNQRPAGTVGS